MTKSVCKLLLATVLDSNLTRHDFMKEKDSVHDPAHIDMLKPNLHPREISSSQQRQGSTHLQ